MANRRILKTFLLITAIAICIYLGWGLAASHLGLSENIRSKIALKKGAICDKQGKYDEAIVYYTESIKLDPKGYLAYYFRGVDHLEKGDYDKAISDLTESTLISPSYAPAFHARGNTYSKKNDIESAIRDLTMAIELNSMPEAYKDRALIYGFRGEYDKAILDINRAIEINPNFGDAYRVRAMAYFSKKEYDKSWTDEHKAESLGAKIDTEFESEFLEELKRESGRDK
jgi:tetratricopeptide (TPR) repeat protein